VTRTAARALSKVISFNDVLDSCAQPLDVCKTACRGSRERWSDGRWRDSRTMKHALNRFAVVTISTKLLSLRSHTSRITDEGVISLGGVCGESPLMKQLKELLAHGARARLAELHAEIATITRAFPDVADATVAAVTGPAGFQRRIRDYGLPGNRHRCGEATRCCQLPGMTLLAYGKPCARPSHPMWS
jgi:hypothetical protein